MSVGMPAFWRPLPWQAALWQSLTRQWREQSLSHALLLSGAAGIGKRRFARALIAYGLCERPRDHACGECASCRLLGAGTHPDASLVGVDGHLGLVVAENPAVVQGLVHWAPDEDRKRRDVPIAAARSLIASLTLATHQGKARFAMIDPADGLNTSSVNALLKSIEEPPPGTHLLLVTERPQALPATLRSRCRQVRLPLPDAASALAWMRDAGCDDADALHFARGAPLRALELTANDGIGLRRRWAELWQKVASRRQDPLSAAAAVDKESMAEHLHWAQNWLGEQLRDQVLAGDAARAQSLAAMARDVIEAQRRLAGNAQPQLLMESLLIGWARRTHPAA